MGVADKVKSLMALHFKTLFCSSCHLLLRLISHSLTLNGILWYASPLKLFWIKLLLLPSYFIIFHENYKYNIYRHTHTYVYSIHIVAVCLLKHIKLLIMCMNSLMIFNGLPHRRLITSYT